MDLAVYVHFPWCIQRCPYCDFATSAIQPERIPHEGYAAAVVAELALRLAPLAPRAPRARTLFFGGGTPSLWALPSLARVVEAAGASDEVTVECNPTSIDDARARAMRDAGVTRLSLGVQSLRDRHLRYLGRAHDAGEARAAVRAAVASGLRVSADVMFGMEGQRGDELVEDLRALVDDGVEHLSCYMLTVEPATRFGELARKGRLPRLCDDDVAALYERCAAEMESLGFEHYEVSNWARPGARARHNEAYWRGDDHLGLGAGAVGCLAVDGAPGSALRWRNDADPAAYVEAISRGALPPAEEERLDPDTRVREGLMLGLRTADGVDLAALAERAGVDPMAGRERAVRREVARGDLVVEGGRARVPRSRWLVADAITARVF
ncbi:MAG: radical SAM family heme chaperone HemW [Polyangiales bacterium]